MKTKIVSLIIALMGFNINAAQAEDSTLKGNLGAKVTSDYQRRGEIVSEQSVQAQIGLNSAVGGVDIFADFFTNQSTDSHHIRECLNKPVLDYDKDFPDV